MNNTFFEVPLLRILNTLLLIGILITQVLILLHIREPIRVSEPVSVDVTNEPSVEITDQPVEVEILR